MSVRRDNDPGPPAAGPDTEPPTPNAERRTPHPHEAAGHTSASYSLTLRMRIDNTPGMLGRIASAIGDAGGNIGAVDLVEVRGRSLIRDITINARDEAHGREIVAALGQVPGAEILHVSDRTFLLHLGGKIEVVSKTPIRTRDDLSMAYTPGVARVCMAIAEDPAKVHTLTLKRTTVAIVSDGSAVLGLGNIGPEAALPVMEGKAALFKEFAGVNAFPLCLDCHEVGQIVDTVAHVAPAFGGINLEDISAPRCFEVERRLQERLDIPVFHDDQHGAAIVVLAALLNALRLVERELADARIVIAGAGAASTATADLLLEAGARDVIVFDLWGIVHPDRLEEMDPVKRQLAERTNPRRLRGGAAEALEGADIFIGLSAGGVLTPDLLHRMAKDPIVFALANPVPEIYPEAAASYARVIGTGRSDYPNQINNVLCFPGMFRGLLHCRASRVNEAIKLAAARAIAGCVAPDELQPDYIVPSVFNRAVVGAVAAAVSRAAVETGVARRGAPPEAAATAAS